MLHAELFTLQLKRKQKFLKLIYCLFPKRKNMFGIVYNGDKMWSCGSFSRLSVICSDTIELLNYYPISFCCSLFLQEVYLTDINIQFKCALNPCKNNVPSSQKHQFFVVSDNSRVTVAE